MPVRKLCSHPCCPRYREEGSRYCSIHASDGIDTRKRWTEKQEYDYLYRSSRWKQLRAQVLDEQNHTCPYCGGEATEVHHLTPHRGNEELFYSRENLVGLCKKCHSQQTQKEISERNK